MKKIAFFDLDKTVYNGASMQRFLFGYLIPKRKIGFFNLLEALLLVFRYGTRLISHNDASKKTIEISARVLNGKSITEVEKWQKDFFSVDEFYPHIPKLFQFLKSKGFTIYIVSASIQPIVKACADVLDVECLASTVEIKNGVYTGTIEALMNEHEKALAVERKSSKDTEVSLGFGDSSGDLDMLKKVDHGFLFEPFEPAIIAQCTSFGITVVNRNTILDQVKKIIQ